MQELQTELEENHNNDLAAARKSAMESRANFTMSMDSLDVEVWTQFCDLLKKLNISSKPRTKRNSSTFIYVSCVACMAGIEKGGGSGGREKRREFALVFSSLSKSNSPTFFFTRCVCSMRWKRWGIMEKEKMEGAEGVALVFSSLSKSDSPTFFFMRCVCSKRWKGVGLGGREKAGEIVLLPPSPPPFQYACHVGYVMPR